MAADWAGAVNSTDRGANPSQTLRHLVFGHSHDSIVLGESPPDDNLRSVPCAVTDTFAEHLMQMPAEWLGEYERCCFDAPLDRGAAIERTRLLSGFLIQLPIFL